MQHRLIIDTNLLLLLVIGAVEGGRHISTSKRLSNFSIDDYDNVLRIMGRYQDVCITPYIATEVSNLIDLNGHSRQLAFMIARELFSNFIELDTNIVLDSASEIFNLYGITDSSLIQLASSHFVLTADTRLFAELFQASQENILPYVPERNL